MVRFHVWLMCEDGRKMYVKSVLATDRHSAICKVKASMPSWYDNRNPVFKGSLITL